MNNELIEEHQHCRQQQEHHRHAEQRASGNQLAHGGNNVDIGVETHAVGCGKEADAADQNALRGRSDGLFNRFFLIEPCNPVLFIPCCQKETSASRKNRNI